MRISDWSSDVCSSDLAPRHRRRSRQRRGAGWGRMAGALFAGLRARPDAPRWASAVRRAQGRRLYRRVEYARRPRLDAVRDDARSEEHTSELQSLMRNSYAVFCLKKKKKLHENKY